MDPARFDDLTKRLATGISRRRLLRGLGSGLAGAVLAGAGFRPVSANGGNSACAHWCDGLFGDDTPAADACISAAAHGQGMCYACGPAAPDQSQKLCGTTCIPASDCCTNSDCTLPQTCGGGGTAHVCGCTPEDTATTCVGKCGAQTNNCGQPVDCGTCCTGNGGDCAAGSDCCSGICQGGTCVATVAGTCLSTDNFCAGGNGLCGNGQCYCTHNELGESLCTTAPMCFTDVSTCDDCHARGMICVSGCQCEGKPTCANPC